MSTLVVPSFIVSLFTNEIFHIHEQLLLDISKTYEIPFEELKRKYLPEIDVISNNLEKINIVKKREYNKNLPSTKQCIALTKNKYQCLRSKGCHVHFCIIHKNNQPYGTINDKSETNIDLSTKHVKKLY